MQYINLNKTLCFETSIIDLLLISIDDQINKTEDKEGIKIIGDIAISGKISTVDGEKDFSDKIDLDVFLIYDEIEDRSLLNVSVNDFSYTIEDSKLLLNISLKLEGLKEIEKTFPAEEDNEDLQKEIEGKDVEKMIFEEVEEDKIEQVEVDYSIYNDRNIQNNSNKVSLLRSVFSNKSINEEVFWRLHCVRGEKSYEEIANKYNVDLKKIMSINKNEEIFEGKLIFLPLD